MFALVLSAALLAQASPAPTITLAPPSDTCYEKITTGPPGLDVYARRHDEPRTVALLAQAAQEAQTCITDHPTDNPYLATMTWQNIGTLWAAAADTAFSAKEYDVARQAALASNAAFEKFLARLAKPDASFIYKKDDAQANINANNDLLARIPH